MLRAILMTAGVLAIPAGIIARRPVEPSAGHPVLRANEILPEARTAPLDSLGNELILHDPFRPQRTPSSTPFNPTPEDPAEVAAPPRPELRLTGMVWGISPSAVIAGLPGRDDPHLMRLGETFNGIRLQRITRDYVFLVGLDTSWVLKVRAPW